MSGSGFEIHREEPEGIEGPETTAGESNEEIEESWITYDFQGETKIATEDLNVHYGEDHTIEDVSIEIPDRSVTALVGPSGCGKSTFLRCLNRMNDRIKSARVEGSVTLDGEGTYQDGVNLVELRKRIGMVFQSPNPSPNRSGTTSPTDRANTATSGRDCSPDCSAAIRERRSENSSNARCVRPPSGRKSRIDSTPTRSDSRAASNNASVSPGVSRPTPR